MTEYNIFCWSHLFNDKNSFQQKRHRVFNKEVSIARYAEIQGIMGTILHKKSLKLAEFWQSLTSDQIKTITDLPEFDKDGFEYITGLKVLDNSLSGKKVEVTIDGVRYIATLD
jgi:hypothetical protein